MCEHKKKCISCDKDLPITEFSYNRKKDNYENICKECIENKKKYSNKKEQERLYRYLTNYNITINDYEALLHSQNNKCAICNSSHSNHKNSKHFFVDHCHITKQVRGLLCHKCNAALGLFRDNEDYMYKAIQYIEKSKYYEVNGVKLRRK